MKLALCLSGQPRSLKRAFNYINHNLLSCNDVDVFIHTWKPEDYDSFCRLYAEIQRFYKPKKFIISDPIANVGQNIIVPNESHPAHGVVSMFYSIMKSNDLRIQHELETGTSYDYVIRSRFDFALNVAINYHTLKRDKLYISKDVEEGNSLFNDQFAIASPNLMNVYASTFLNAQVLYEDGVDFCAHSLLEEMMKRFNINCVRLDLDHPFVDGRFNIGRHSLIRDDMENWVDIKTWGY